MTFYINLTTVVTVRIPKSERGKQKVQEGTQWKRLCMISATSKLRYSPALVCGIVFDVPR